MPQDARIADRIIILGSPLESTRIVNFALIHEFATIKVIVEEQDPRRTLLACHLKRLGARNVIGQVLSWLVVPLVIEATSRARISALKKGHGLDDWLTDEAKVTRVESVNAMGVIDLLYELSFSIVVNWASIIATKVLEGIPARFINMHDGITPLYHGGHGTYWALIEGNRSACGVTALLVVARASMPPASMPKRPSTPVPTTGWRPTLVPC
jgi:methionyl-tRNA formyltransferase